MLTLQPLITSIKNCQHLIRASRSTRRRRRRRRRRRCRVVKKTLHRFKGKDFNQLLCVCAANRLRVHARPLNVSMTENVTECFSVINAHLMYDQSCKS